MRRTREYKRIQEQDGMEQEENQLLAISELLLTNAYNVILLAYFQ